LKTEKQDYNNINCPSCDSTKVKREGGISGWDFITECLECKEKSYYILNDQMGCEGCAPYSLIETGKEYKQWGKELIVMNILTKCEEGWQNKNGKSYEKYDRLLHTAKNLIEKDFIKYEKD